jgi:hypothetical protein
MAPASATPAPKTKVAAARAVSPASIFLPWPAPPKNDRVSPEVAMAYAAVNEPAPLMELGNVQRSEMLGQSAPIPAQPPLKRPTAAPRATPVSSVVSSVTSNVNPLTSGPWLRAVILAPTMYQYMAMQSFNPPDKRQFAVFMQKPSSVLTMDFSADPYSGMISTAFTGKAIQFLATVQFGVRTAALR